MGDVEKTIEAYRSETSTEPSDKRELYKLRERKNKIYNKLVNMRRYSLYFDNWNISGCVKLRMLDNKTSSFDVVGDIPEGWSWWLLYSCNGNLNIAEMKQEENILSVIFTKEMLPTDGTYLFQLKATKDDLVKHTNIVKTYVNKSLSGDLDWPVIPTEFTQIEQAVKGYAESAKESATKAENAAVHSPIIGENGNWFVWDFTKSEYVDSGKPASIGGGTDISLGIAGATVGQIAKITEVDETGKPTKWEPVDMAGWGESEYELVFSDEIKEDVGSYYRNTDMNGEPFSLTDVIVVIFTKAFAESTNNAGRGISFVESGKWAFNAFNISNSIPNNGSNFGKYDVSRVKLVNGYQTRTIYNVSQNSTNVFGTMQEVSGNAPGMKYVQFLSDKEKLFSIANPKGAITCLKIVGYVNPLVSAGSIIKMYKRKGT